MNNQEREVMEMLVEAVNNLIGDGQGTYTVETKHDAFHPLELARQLLETNHVVESHGMVEHNGNPGDFCDGLYTVTTTRHVTDLIAPDATVTDYPIVIRETVELDDGTMEKRDYVPQPPVIDNGKMVFEMPDLQYECSTFEDILLRIADTLAECGIDKVFCDGEYFVLIRGQRFVQVELQKILGITPFVTSSDLRRAAEEHV